MANPDPSRTEWPTAKKLGEARDDGNVLSCPDVTSVVVLAFGTLLLFLTLPRLAEAFRDIILLIPQIDCRETWMDSQIVQGTTVGAILLLKILAPICLGICLFSILVMRAQIGSFFSFKPLKWKFDTLWNPKAALNELVPTKESLKRFLITGAKVTIVGWLIYVCLKSNYPEFTVLNRMPLWNGVMWVVQEVTILVFKIIALLLFIAGVSYWLRYKQYYDNLMMTKQEVKDEHKNQDGDPLIKSKIRSKMRELLIRAIKGSLKKADVVVTNPTHVAVAIKYDPTKDFAPMVVAKGLRKRAEHIKALAKVYGIPIVEAPPLARSLYRNVKVAAFIPPEFYRAVAAILAKLQRQGLSRRKSYLNKEGGKAKGKGGASKVA